MTERDTAASADGEEGVHEMTTRHAREIQDVVDEHHALAQGKEGHDLLEVRKKASRAIAEACRRHVAEAHAMSHKLAPPIEPSGDALEQPADEAKPAPAEPPAADAEVL